MYKVKSLTDLPTLQRQISVVEAEMQGMSEDLREMKETQKELLKFMYKVEGGKAWLFAVLMVAGTLGGLFNNLISSFIKH